jgi:hypothetical protein
MPWKPETQLRLDNTFLQVVTTMLQTAQRNDALSQLRIGDPDPVPKKARRKKAHGPANTAGLASADLLVKGKAERAANQAANHAPKPTNDEDPSSLPPSAASLRLEESGSTKRTRGRTLDFVALHMGTASKKGKALGITLRVVRYNMWQYSSYI